MKSRPPTATPVYCPACSHPVDSHNTTGCEPNMSVWCRCQWTANDIAWWLLYGQLTPVPSVATLEPTIVHPSVMLEPGS